MERTARRWVSVTQAASAPSLLAAPGAAGPAEAQSVWQWLKPEDLKPGLERDGAQRPVVKGQGPSALMAHTTSALGSHVLIYGGVTSTDVVCGEAFLLDTERWEWSEVKPGSYKCPARRAYHTASVISRDRVVMIGGEGPNKSHYYLSSDILEHSLETVDVFDMATRKWSSVSTVGPPQARSGHAAVVLSDDRIMIFGGSSKMNVCAKQFHILHTKSEPWRWETVRFDALLPDSRFGHSMVAINSHSAVLFGGKNFQYEYDDVWLISPDYKEIECLPPQTDSEEIPALYGHSALAIASQMVVIGGKSYQESSDEIYIFDLQQRKWRRQRTSVTMNDCYLPRYYQGCCVINGSNVFMFGGFSLSWGTQDDMVILETGIATSGLVKDFSSLLEKGIISDFTIRVNAPGPSIQIQAHRALILVRCPSLLEAVDSDQPNMTKELEGNLEAWNHFMHFIYTGIFAEGDSPSNSDGLESKARRLAMSDAKELIESIRAINARFPVNGLDAVLSRALITGQLPKKEFMHGETLPGLVDALSSLLEENERDTCQDITLRLSSPDQATSTIEYSKPAHRFMLAARSEYFRAMLRFDGASTAQHRELVLSESITPQALGVLLEFFYTDRVNTANMEVDLALEMVGIANEYLLTDLKFFVERFIIMNDDAVDEENVFFVLEASDHYSAHELRYHCIDLIARNADAWAITGDTRSQQVASLPRHLRQVIKERQKLLEYR